MTTDQNGYTILETLAALAILSVALVTFYGVGGTSVRTLGHVERVQTAMLLAQSKLDEVAGQQNVLDSRTSGRFAGTPFRWSIAAKRLPEPVTRYNAAHLQDVVLTISWQEGLNDQSITINTRHLGRSEQ